MAWIDGANATTRAYLQLLDALGRRPDAGRDGVRALEVSLKLSALGQALDRDGETIALANAHAICERAEQVGACGDGGAPRTTPPRIPRCRSPFT